MKDASALHVLITGADKGLGFALVSRFLNAGYQVHAGSYYTLDNLKPLIHQYRKNLQIVHLDVSDMNSICEAFMQVVVQTELLDILINNASVHLHPKPLQMIHETNFMDGHLERTLEVNTFGPLRVTQQFLPLLRKGTRKLILNISSEAGSIADCRRIGEYAYCMSKAALNIQSRILQNDLESGGFQVLAIHPGWMRTEMGGPDADIDPAEAAEGIYRLTLQSHQSGEPMFIDYTGKPLRW